MLEEQHPSGRRSTKKIVLKGVHTIVFCCWHVIRKAFWGNLEVRNLKILHNICLFSSSYLCPLGCLSFVRWKNQNKMLRNISGFLTSRFCQITFLMTCQQHNFQIFFPNSSPNKKKLLSDIKLYIFHILSPLKEKWELKIGKD